MWSAKFASSGIQLCQRFLSAVRRKEPDQEYRDPRLRDVERLTRDIDAAMSDMRLLTRQNAGPDSLMPARLELLGLDPGYVRVADPDTYEALRRTCATCPSWRACARDLAPRNGSPGNATRGLSSYCLNAGRIDALILER
jgi:hypothetical protein